MKLIETSLINPECKAQNFDFKTTSKKMQLSIESIERGVCSSILADCTNRQPSESSFYQKAIYPYPTFYEAIPQGVNTITTPIRVIIKAIDLEKLCMVTEDDSGIQQTWKIPFIQHAAKALNISDSVIVRPSPLGNHMEIFALWPPIPHIEESIKKADVIKSRVGIIKSRL